MLIHKEKQKLGELLKDINLLNEEQVRQALTLQKEQGIKFGDAVVKLGFLTKDDINWALSNQLNIPYIADLREKGIFDPDSVALLPYDFAKKHCVIILGQMPDAINIVIADPLNQTVIGYIEQITGKHINVSIGDEQAIMRMIDDLYKNNSCIAATEQHGEGNVSQIKTEINKVFNEIGSGFDADVYKNALCVSFNERAKKNVSIQLVYRDAEVGKYFIDIMIDNAIGVLFSNRDINEQHINSLLKLSNLQGLIVIKITEKLIIDAFPRDQQEQIRTMLSESLKAVVSQQLIKTIDGKGRIAALEIMVVTPAISNLIREAKSFQIPSMIQIGKKDGMQVMDQAILDLLKMKKISATEAYTHANNKAMFEQYMSKDMNLDMAYGMETGAQGLSPKKDITDKVTKETTPANKMQEVNQQKGITK